MDLQFDKQYTKVIFEEELNLSSIAYQFEIIKEALNSGKTIILSAEKIKKIDPASLQLLFMFILEMDKKNINYQWENFSNVLQKTANSLGLCRALNLPDSKETEDDH